jgi:hypothetical protein
VVDTSGFLRRPTGEPFIWLPGQHTITAFVGDYSGAVIFVKKARHEGLQSWQHPNAPSCNSTGLGECEGGACTEELHVGVISTTAVHVDWKGVAWVTVHDPLVSSLIQGAFRFICPFPSPESHFEFTTICLIGALCFFCSVLRVFGPFDEKTLH